MSRAPVEGTRTDARLRGARIHITGIVQGVGFRPFVYGLAQRLKLPGWVRNTSAGVEIEVDGPESVIQSFVQALRLEAPPLAQVDSLEHALQAPNGYTKFEIRHSEAIPRAFQPISPDVTVCTDCLEELADPTDRRYRYPFTNCTNCGPRFTIIRDIPYDRPKTTMADFPLCPDCAREYADPLDRRFHAQPVACPICGPEIWLEIWGAGGRLSRAASADQALLALQRLLLDGKIAAIKGLGGFHLACDAANSQTVARLRERKLRVDKPFALMAPNIETVAKHCRISPAEAELISSRERPIVILKRRPDSPLPAELAPGQDTLGFMLPYTPLHALLFDPVPGKNSPSPAQVLVMTSANLSEEPIATVNEEARTRLADLADVFLMHNRPIHTRCDDSVVRAYVSNGEKDILYPLRRSRGYAPSPIRLPFESVPILACGPELKNTFCLGRDEYAFLSHHIGDLENYETLQAFETGISHFERLFKVQPEALAYDLHPNYLATRYALERAGREDLPTLGVQHHHAHIAACMAEHSLPIEEQVIGVAFDGTGYGDDGAIWGGEFLIGGYDAFRRHAHLAYFPLPGGDTAVRRPARTALGLLASAGLEWDPALPPVNALCAEERQAVRSQIEHSLNAPSTSSIGRLFDAVAALAGVRQRVNYEAQAAIELEALADPEETRRYEFDLHRDGPDETLTIDPFPLLQALLYDYAQNIPVARISARFHNGLAQLVLFVCRHLHDESGLKTVALSGGVWQNMTLLSKTVPLLQKDGFKVLVHRRVPTNDGGVALGQLAVANARLGEK